jgi:hypothetical protein
MLERARAQRLDFEVEESLVLDDRPADAENAGSGALRESRSAGTQK